MKIYVRRLFILWIVWITAHSQKSFFPVLVKYSPSWKKFQIILYLRYSFLWFTLLIIFFGLFVKLGYIPDLHLWKLLMLTLNTKFHHLVINCESRHVDIHSLPFSIKIYSKNVWKRWKKNWMSLKQILRTKTEVLRTKNLYDKWQEW
jgi:hypothetical protein